MLDKKLFRVYFSDYTNEIYPSHFFSYRHILADDKQDAENIVREMIQQNKEFFDSKNFNFKYISEEVIYPFSDYIEGKNLNYNAIFEKMKDEAIAEEDREIFELVETINILVDINDNKQE